VTKFQEIGVLNFKLFGSGGGTFVACLTFRKELMVQFCGVEAHRRDPSQQRHGLGQSSFKILEIEISNDPT